MSKKVPEIIVSEATVTPHEKSKNVDLTFIGKQLDAVGKGATQIDEVQEAQNQQQVLKLVEM